MKMIPRDILIRKAKQEKAKRNFYYYCKLMHPNFYNEKRGFLEILCDKLQEFYFNDDEFMLVNLPP